MNERLKQINLHLYSMLGSVEFVQRWWLGPNMAFQLQCPQEVWDSGDEGKDQIEAYVMQAAYGGGA
jgi:hypothetical protein